MFSVIIPVYNREGLIEETLNSVLNQTVLPNEIIVCDDGSTDNTVKKIHDIMSLSGGISYKIIRHENQGPSYARKKAVEASTGTWLLFLDSDDVWDSNYIESIKTIASTQNAECIVSNFRSMDIDNGVLLYNSKFSYAPDGFWEEGVEKEGGIYYTKSRGGFFLKALVFQPCFPSGLSCSRHAYDMSGGITLYSRKLKSEDSHFIRKLFFYCTVFFNPQPVLTINVHSGGRSNSGKGKLDFTGKLSGRLEILQMLIEDEEISKAFFYEIKHEIEKSTVSLFNQFYWAEEYANAVKVYKKIPKPLRSLRVRFKYLISLYFTYLLCVFAKSYKGVH